VGSISVSSREDLINFLQGNPNIYNNFILGFYLDPKYNPKQPKKIGWEIHHIFPLNRTRETPDNPRGTDEDWNIIYIPLQDHFKAHCFLAVIHADPSDLKYLARMNVNLEEARQNLEVFNEKTDQYVKNLSPHPLSTERYSTQAYIEEIFKQEHYWQYEFPNSYSSSKNTPVNTIIKLEPNEVKNFREFYYSLLSKIPPSSPTHQKLLNDEKNLPHFKTKINNVIRGRQSSHRGLRFIDPRLFGSQDISFSEKNLNIKTCTLPINPKMGKSVNADYLTQVTTNWLFVDENQIKFGFIVHPHEISRISDFAFVLQTN
jgi:hypothetical protein